MLMIPSSFLDGSHSSLQTALNMLEIVGSISSLKVNIDKTKLIWIGKKHCKDKLIKEGQQLVNYSLSDGSFPSAFKRAVVTPSLKRHLCPKMTLRITAQCLIFVSSQSWLSELLLSNLCHTSILTNWIIHISQPISQDILLKQLYCL